jgi:tetratricopeptide (TPR) repeat protein
MWVLPGGASAGNLGICSPVGNPLFFITLNFIMRDHRFPVVKWIRMSTATLLLVSLPIASWPTPADGQELISVVDSDSGTVTQFRGQVLAWDADRLTYMSGERQRNMPARRVTAVEYEKSAEQRDADHYFAGGKFDQAALSFENALGKETRVWVAEEMRARRLQCAAATGDNGQALIEFMELIRANPKTRFFHLIPLAWQPNDRMGGTLTIELQKWLAVDDPVRGLLAGSWLLANDQPAATDRLRKLSIAADPAIAHLATAQLWRLQTISADVEELRRWRIAIDRMPEPLQPGPRLLAAMVQKRLAADDLAVVALLQVPILFPDQYQLSGQALLEAHELLQSLGRSDEAALVAQELVTAYGQCTAAYRFQNPVERFDQ